MVYKGSINSILVLHDLAIHVTSESHQMPPPPTILHSAHMFSGCCKWTRGKGFAFGYRLTVHFYDNTGTKRISDVSILREALVMRVQLGACHVLHAHLGAQHVRSHTMRALYYHTVTPPVNQRVRLIC